jgi:catechol 2,3-dioxygenase-like lactoylglutathione lyase family enzyme
MKTRWLLILGLAVLFAGPIYSFAQSGQITGIAHIAYRVADLDKEVAFLQKLGYEQAFGFTNSQGKTSEVFVKVNDRQFIEVYPQTDSSQPLGWMHVCYESDDITTLAKALTGRGLTPDQVRKAGAGNLISALKDPEGRTTEFTQYMPGSRHTLDRGQHLGAHRVSDQLIGFSLPVPDTDAARKFYAAMGFEARDTRTGLRFTLSSVPDLRIQIRKAESGISPQTEFRISDAAETAKQLQSAGLTIKQDRNRVLVTDPDGNTFAFVAPRTR